MNKHLVSVLALAGVLATTASAKDFKLATLKQAKNPTFDLSGGNLACTPYYNSVRDKGGIADKMEEAGGGASSTNVTKLQNGQGVSVKLNDKNYNIHINFPASEMGGRSYGWTSGKVGDWSDAMYLENIASVMDAQDKAEIGKFYKVIIGMLGCSSPKGLDGLELDTQRVATNFLAIYTAEEYRRVQKATTRWDDALMQVTLLAAFHGGQDNFAMYYAGEFTDTTKEKGPGVYSNGSAGPIADDAKDKDADMTDYHQFSGKTPDQSGSNRSGINLTRKDFEKMGAAITNFEKNNKNLKAVEAIIGASPNVIKQLAAYFAEGKAKGTDTGKLATAVSALMLDIFNDANAITKQLLK